MSLASLLPQHLELIEASAIAPEVAAARGYRSVMSKSELGALGFGRAQQRVPTLLIPIRDVTGAIATYLSRPDEPRIADGKALKYEIPSRSRMAIDVPAAARSFLNDPDRPLFITEGARKADAAVSSGLCCVSLIGVWCWRGTNLQGGKAALPDFESIALNGRAVYIVFDSDVMTKHSVHAALARLKPFLEQRGASVRVIYLPPAEGGAKVGLDDYLATGHGVDDLLARATTELRPSPGGSEREYEATPQGLVYKTPRPEGRVPTLLTNFTARIVADVLEDDGAEIRRFLEIEVTVGEKQRRITVPADQFDSMRWVSEQVGLSAWVKAGQLTRDRAREAIQAVSGEIPEARVYAHTGWVTLDEEPVYLHARGAIGRGGRIADVKLKLPGLEHFELPAPPAAAREAVRASLALLEIGPEAITVPVLAAVTRAVLGPADFSIHVAGPTGAFKTELAVLAQQHFGADFRATNLPGSWTSTENAIEALLFTAKDALCVVDDFTPSGSPHDVQRRHAQADRVLRAQGNRSGRGRLRPDGTPRAVKSPRGIMLSTGEDVPTGKSLRARTLILELQHDSIDQRLLSRAQRAACRGLYAQALSGYVSWLAPRYSSVREGLDAELAELRTAAQQSTLHRRTPAAIADLAVGLRHYLAYAVDCGAISDEEAESLGKRAWCALRMASAAQRLHQEGSDPVRRFLELLSSSIASGVAHVAASTGSAPERPDAWGWRQVVSGGGYDRDEWRAHGNRIGWVDGADLYLDADASFKAAQAVGRDIGDALAVTPATLRKRLAEAGRLASTDLDTRRATISIRRSLEGRRREVLHLHSEILEGSLPWSGSSGTQPHHGGMGVVLALPGGDAGAPDLGTRNGARLPERSGRGELHGGGSDDPTPGFVHRERNLSHMVGMVGSLGENETYRREADIAGVSAHPLNDSAFVVVDDPTAPEPCRYPSHRGSDWRLPGERRRICGECHPPAAQGPIERLDREERGP